MPRVIKCDKCHNNFLQQWIVAKKQWSQINQATYWTNHKWNHYQLFCRSCLKDWFEKEKNLFDKLVEPKKKKLFLGYRSCGVFNKKDLLPSYQPFEFSEPVGKEKVCLECEKTLSFLAVKSDGYLCGKVKCLRVYIRKNEK